MQVRSRLTMIVFSGFMKFNLTQSRVPLNSQSSALKLVLIGVWHVNECKA